jgi:hypothetical protein
LALSDFNLSGSVSGTPYKLESDFVLLWQGNDFSNLYQEVWCGFHPPENGILVSQIILQLTGMNQCWQDIYKEVSI